MKRGRLVVIDGSDGSGKATQSRLLVARLKKEGRKVATLDFPQYENNTFGKLIGECLAGERGDFRNLDPYIASTLYAVDRFESSKKIEGWLKKGYVVILDRYVSSNQIHQGGKMRDAKKRTAFLKWLDHVEFGILKLPRPDMVLYLSVPVEVSVELLKNKDQKKKKVYTKGKKDVVEGDLSYLKESRAGVEAIVKKLNNWKKVQCTSRGNMRSREDIHEDVYTEVKAILKK